MNQAFGGAFLIKIALVFLSIYIVVLGFAMNYAKVFTFKNRLISLIEKYEGYDDSNVNSEFMEKVRYEADRIHYKGATSGREIDCDNQQNIELYCIKAINDPSNPSYTYYKITTYIQFKIPVASSLAAGTIPITGETKYIFDFDN